MMNKEIVAKILKKVFNFFFISWKTFLLFVVFSSPHFGFVSTAHLLEEITQIQRTDYFFNELIL
jgi:hypothetical protein